MPTMTRTMISENPAPSSVRTTWRGLPLLLCRIASVPASKLKSQASSVIAPRTCSLFPGRRAPAGGSLRLATVDAHSRADRLKLLRRQCSIAEQANHVLALRLFVQRSAPRRLGFWRAGSPIPLRCSSSARGCEQGNRQGAGPIQRGSSRRSCQPSFSDCCPGRCPEHFGRTPKSEISL
jgi:hypothetical protein